MVRLCGCEAREADLTGRHEVDVVAGTTMMLGRTESVPPTDSQLHDRLDPPSFLIHPLQFVLSPAASMTARVRS